MLSIPLPGAVIAYAYGCGVLLKIEVPSTNHIGFAEVDCKSMQLDEVWEFFLFFKSFIAHWILPSCSINSCLVLRAFRGMVVS